MELVIGLVGLVVFPVTLVCWRDLWRRICTYLEYRDALKAMHRWEEHRNWHSLD